MTKLFTILLLLLPIISFSQKELKTIDLSDSGNTLNTNYFQQLDSIFEKSRLIALGESTHGTSEFTAIRAELFKYMVKKYNYSIFFLEADYNACSRVNRYIHGFDDDGKEALIEVRLWPWITQELLDLIEWMRIYNNTHENKLEFVGCDMQLIVDDKVELNRLFSTNPKFHEYLSKIPNLDFNTKDSALTISKQKEWVEFSKNFSNAFPDEENLIITSVTQWFENATSQIQRANFRDSCMGNNIADYLDKTPSAKGIFFAHNGHVGKIAFKFNDLDEHMKRAGHFLDERLKDQYFAIALEFNTGSFNAINYKNDEYVMEYFTINKRDRRSLAHFVLGKEDKIKYIESHSIPSKKYLKINSIGAIYGKSINGYKIYRYRKLNRDHYDAFIVINKATPTKLLTMNSIKN